MGRKKANHPLIESLEIVAVAAEGKALGRWNDIVVFVPMAVPGRRGRRTGVLQTPEIHGRAVSSVSSGRSPLRVEPVCEHFGVCGGCKWQNQPYDEQLRFKQEQVAEQLKRIGGIELPEIGPIRGSRQTLFYRNKLEFTFSDRRWLTPEEIAAPGRAGAGTGPRLPYSGTVRQGARHPQMLAAADPSNAIRQELRAILHRPGLLVLRYPRASGTDAQPDRAHRVDGRGDGDRRVRGRRPRAHRRAAEPHEGALSRTGIADVGRQHETQRHDRRSGNPPAQRARPYFRRDGKPAFQGRAEIVLPNQLVPSLRTVTR